MIKCQGLTFVVAILVIMTLGGCYSEDGESILTQIFYSEETDNVSGPRGQVLVVCDNEVWESEAGEAIREILERPYAVLPQMHTKQFEPTFDLVHKRKEDFNKLWKHHRNIVFLDVTGSKGDAAGGIRFLKDKLTKGQIYVEGKSNSISELAVLLRDKADEMVNIIENAEARRSSKTSEQSVNQTAQKKLKRLIGIDLIIPKGAEIVKSDSSLIWIDRQLSRVKGSRHDVQQGILIHSEPYIGSFQYNLEYVLERRDMLTQKHLPGPTDGSYMTTERGMVFTHEEITFKGRLAVEVRGLWRMENDFMGGPFYSLTFYNESSGRLITVEGYAYAPYFAKREYMREIVGIVKSASFSEE